MRLTFFNGVQTVGGVQILLTDAASSLQFDLGVVRNPAIAPQQVLFNDFVSPRPDGLVEDYLRAGMTPRVAGLFRSGDGATDPVEAFSPLTVDLPLVSHEERGELALFVSHMHDDHMALLPSVAPDVPVVLNDETARMLDLLVEAGGVAPLAAPVHRLAAGQAHQVGALSCEPVPIDHDIPGAAGFVTATPSGTVAYTGDWRSHGADPRRTERFAQRCADAEVDVLITEASTLVPGDPRPQISEAQLLEQLAQTMADCQGLVLVGVYARNLGRLLRVLDVVAASGRRMAVQAATAQWLDLAVKHGLATADDVAAVVAFEDAAGGGHGSFAQVSAADVARNRDDFVCESTPASWHQWLDLQVGRGDCYVHANGAPFGTADPMCAALETWVDQLGPSLVVLDSHGHASPADLEWLVKQIEPKVVIPVHSNHPDLFPVGNYRLVLPQRGERLDLSF